MKHRQSWRVAAVGLAALGLLLAACGGDDSGSSSNTTAAAAGTTAAATTAAGGAGTTAAGGAGTTLDSMGGMASEEAAARVEAFRQPVTELPLNEPIKVEPGKKLFYVQCSVPVCAEIATGIEAAAKAAGWDYQTTSHQDTPETVAAAFDAAIAAKPDVVLTSGNPREWFQDQLTTLEKDNIPVVAWSIPEGYEPGKGISVNLLTNDDYYFYGTLMADWAAQNTKSGQVLFVGLPTFPVLSTVQEGFKTEIATACPTCNVTTKEVAVTDIGTNLPGQIVSELQKNPDIDTVVYAFGGMLFGVPDALKAAGLEDQAKAISQAGGPLNFGFIENGQHQAAEVGLASELLGWRAVDAAARILAGKGPGRTTTPEQATLSGHPDILAGGLPLQILEKGSIEDPTALWPGVPGFQQKFQELWAG